MGHHIAGVSNSAKRRAAVAEENHGQPESSNGIAPGMTDAFHAMQSRFASLCTIGREKVVEAEHSVAEQIHNRPLISMLAALSIGIIIGAVSTAVCKRR